MQTQLFSSIHQIHYFLPYYYSVLAGVTTEEVGEEGVNDEFPIYVRQKRMENQRLFDF